MPVTLPRPQTETLMYDSPHHGRPAHGSPSQLIATVAGQSRPSQEPLPVPGVVLVVDDDDPVRVMLARLLRTQGYAVLQATSAQEAYQLLDESDPDLVISDIVMPGESGIELRRFIAEHRPDLPVILISGYSTDGPAEFAARTPNTLFVQKPFAADQLLQLVESTLCAAPNDEKPVAS